MNPVVVKAGIKLASEVCTMTAGAIGTYLASKGLKKALIEAGKIAVKEVAK